MQCKKTEHLLKHTIEPKSNIETSFNEINESPMYMDENWLSLKNIEDFCACREKLEGTKYQYAK